MWVSSKFKKIVNFKEKIVNFKEKIVNFKDFFGKKLKKLEKNGIFLEKMAKKWDFLEKNSQKTSKNFSVDLTQFRTDLTHEF